MDPVGLRGRRRYGGLDLSSNIDLTTFVMVFPPEVEGDPFQALCRFWIPEDYIHERVRRDWVPYDVWVRQGFVTATPGNVIDYQFIYSQLQEDADDYDLVEVAFDRWGRRRWCRTCRMFSVRSG